jgi:hypothetical protein
MSQGVPQYPCTICGHGGHRPSNCKEIGIPPDGFYKPAPGQHQHDDDDDEMIHIAELLYSYKKWLYRVVKHAQMNHRQTKKLSLP